MAVSKECSKKFFEKTGNRFVRKRLVLVLICIWTGRCSSQTTQVPDTVISTSGSTNVDTGIILSSQTCVVFAVTTSKYAVVQLSTVKNVFSSNAYSIYLDGPVTLYSSGSSVYITRNGASAADLIYPSLMNATTPQWFWITWGIDNLVTLGRGRVVGSDHLLVYNESSPIQVNYMAVGSIKAGCSATWTVPAAFYSNREFTRVTGV